MKLKLIFAFILAAIIFPAKADNTSFEVNPHDIMSVNPSDTIIAEYIALDSIAVDSTAIPLTSDTITSIADVPKQSIWEKYGDKTTRFRPQQLILPVALVAIGSFGVCNGWFRGIDNKVKDGMDNLRGDHYFHADDYIQYLPVVANVGLGLAKVPCKHTFVERIAITATAYISLGILVNGIKYSVKEKRPDSGAHNSFPSGHTATAFMGAELVRISYPLGVGIGAYAVATGVAFLRLYNGRHWLNDVIAGAGIGILSARIGYWLLPLNRKLFHIRPKSTTIITSAPFYDPYNRAFGASLAIRL